MRGRPSLRAPQLLIHDPAMNQVLGARRWFDGTKLHDDPVFVHVRGESVVRIGGIGEPGLDPLWLEDDAVLCPGFIDSHSHSDYALADEPMAIGALMQGITTQVIGQCGFSAAPIGASTARATASDDPTYVATAGKPRWRTMGEYREILLGFSPGVNVLPFVGHNSLITTAGGNTETVLSLADSAIDEGARGVSTGLSYHPGRHSTDIEVVALASLAGRRGVPYHTHMRYSSAETLDTLSDTLRQLSGACGTVTISHAFPRLRDRRTTAESILDELDRFAPNFDSLTTDVTVYDTGGTPWSHGLPLWATEGSASNIREAASDASWREPVIDHLRTEADGWVCDWTGLAITKVNHTAHRHLLGRTVQEIADVDGIAPEVAVIDLLAADGHFWVSPPNKAWRDVLDLLMHDRCIPMVDGITVDPRRDDRIVGLDRSWNTFRRFLARAMPEAPISLEAGLRKLTADAAERLAISHRGILAPGAAADLVVVKPADVAELHGPDFDMTGMGIEAVMVNGHWAYRSEAGFADRGAGIVL